jgi:hypothetical protein
MAENLNTKITVEAWAQIVIKEWIKKANALGIGQTGALINSFTSTIYTAAEGDPNKVVFAFEWYGKMVDYGVGKYVDLADRDGMIAGGMTKRRPKPFFSDTFYKQLAVLRHLMEEKYAAKAEWLMVRNWSDNADYGYKEVKV